MNACMHVSRRNVFLLVVDVNTRIRFRQRTALYPVFFSRRYTDAYVCVWIEFSLAFVVQVVCFGESFSASTRVRPVFLFGHSSSVLVSSFDCDLSV